MIRTLPAAALALAVTSLTTAQAERQCHRALAPSATTNWSTAVAIPKFDPALGVLTEIEVTLAAEATGSAKFESLDAAASTVTMNFQSTLTLTRPDLSVLVVAIPQQAFVDNVTAHDGSIDFAGTSGKAYAGIVANAAAAIVSPPPPGDLALFTGAWGNPGSILLPISATGTSSGSGAGNLLLQFAQSASAIVTVCYEYEPRITRLCVGDPAEGVGVTCPCSNWTPSNPGGCLNSTGLGGLLEGTGVPSVSNDTLLLSASQLPPTVPGFFFQGTASEVNLHGNLGVIAGAGVRCVGGTLIRMAKIVSAPQFGTVDLPLAGDPPISQQFGLQAGDTRYYQVWYRNLNGPCGEAFNTTNALRVIWGL